MVDSVRRRKFLATKRMTPGQNPCFGGLAAVAKFYATLDTFKLGFVFDGPETFMLLKDLQDAKTETLQLLFWKFNSELQFKLACTTFLRMPKLKLIEGIGLGISKAFENEFRKQLLDNAAVRIV